ncbi:MAG: helix-turn-helix domain-containing protein [Actinomycetia bacterium]|nr:helix-turn-helix domain-containing protein [Actinomycetes bacterium]
MDMDNGTANRVNRRGARATVVRNTGEPPLQRSLVRTYLNGAITIIGVLAMLAYLSFVQAMQAFSEASGSIDEFQALFASRMATSTVLIAAVGLFIYFFSIQDYQLTINKLLKTLADNLSKDDVIEIRTAQGSQSLVCHKGSSFSEGLDSIAFSVRTILQEKESIIEQLDSQEQQIRESLVLRLLKGWVKDSVEARNESLKYGLDIEKEQLQVVLFGTNALIRPLPDDETQRTYQVLRNILQQLFAPLFICHIVEVEGMVAVLIFPIKGESLLHPANAADLLSVIKLSLQMVYEESGVSLRASIGSVFYGIAGVSQSYAEAGEALRYANIVEAESQVSRYRPDGYGRSGSDWELEWSRQELQFMNCIDIQDIDGAFAVFQNMLGSYSSGAPAAFGLLQQRMLGLANMMVTALGRLRLSMGESGMQYQELCERITKSNTLPEMQQNAQAVFDELRSQIKIYKYRSLYAQMVDVADYVKEHYGDHNLTVAAIAEHFNLNVSHLSRTFKRTMGVGLAGHIQKVRVDAAKELLKNEHVSVKSAAEKVGFGTVLTMNRAFRRQEGTTAGRLRHSNGQ